MISNLKITLNNTDLNVNMSSLLQGFIMEIVNPDFAEKEHISGLRSYNQYLSKNDKNQWIWTINTFNEYAKENIIDKIINLDKIYLKKKDIFIEISSYEISQINFDELFEKYYFNAEKSSKYIDIEFLTPTAFKSNGEYINYPNINLFFSSIINKYDKSSDTTSIYEENMLNKLTEATSIVNYNLKTKRFYLENIKINGFIGKLTIKITGSKNITNLINMLIDFAQYSGVGIKCAIGMGALAKIKKSENEVK